MHLLPLTPLGARRWLAAGLLAAARLATAQTVAPAPAGLPEPIRQALADSGLPASSLSLWVQSVDGGALRLAWNADTPRAMASVMKLVTTGVALRALGPAYTWRTTLALGGPLDAQGTLHGALHIRAGGDPSLDGMRLAAAMREWRSLGLRTIQGDVRVDRSLFLLPPHDPAAFDGQTLKPYNAGPDAWLLAHQAVTLQFRAAGPRPGRVRVALTPSLDGVELDAQVALAPAGTPCGAWREALSLDISPPDGIGRRTVRVRGVYPPACGDAAWPLLWPQSRPGEHGARLFEAAWQEAGGQLKGQVSEAPWPADALPWAVWSSPPLAEVVRDINKFSNNVMARQLFLTLAAQTPGQAATLDQARALATEHVRLATRSRPDRAGPCEGAALALDNGSGLSRTEAATARCMASWIGVMWADPTMPEWLSSLPVAGVDGTARRMTAAIGQAHLKTGSIEGVASIAGIVHDARGQRQVFVAVFNDPRANMARPVLQAALGWAQGAAWPTPGDARLPP
jgi:D-alanyl-D-alanine carboxypeptidase/D-alanyl-D-alanine-endopeptidase (penicillin-binding protein 4)